MMTQAIKPDLWVGYASQLVPNCSVCTHGNEIWFIMFNSVEELAEVLRVSVGMLGRRLKQCAFVAALIVPLIERLAEKL